MEPLSWYSLPPCTLLRYEAPRMANVAERGLEWAGLPVIATVARLFCHTGRMRDAAPGR